MMLSTGFGWGRAFRGGAGRSRRRGGSVSGLGAERLESRELLTTASDLATALTHSGEYFTGVVTADYQTFLGRAPSPSELSYYVNQLLVGDSDENVVAALTASQEFYNRVGATDTAWVNGAYQALLGRAPITDPSYNELSYDLNSLAGGNSRYNISLALARSGEHEARVVSYDYGRYLNRTASASEVNGWVNLILAGSTEEQVIAGFVGSAEFSRLHDVAAPNVIRAAYLTTLGRLPQPPELNYWVGALEGITPTNVPAQGVYAISVSGSVGGEAFSQYGTLGVAPTVTTSGPQINPIDVGLDTQGNPLTAGPIGSLDFASNLELYNVAYAGASVTPMVLGDITTSPATGAVSVKVDAAAHNTTTYQNSFTALVSGSTTTQFIVRSGTITLQFSQSGSVVTGTINLTGSPAGSSALVTYTANLSGTLA